MDDEPSNLTVFRSTFRRDFQVLVAESAEKGLEIIHREADLSVIISDQRMPEMSGVQMLAQARRIQPDAIRMILTAYTDVDEIIASINEGHIYRFITKPWAEAELRVTLMRAAETYALQRLNQKLTEELIRAEKLASVGKMASAMGHEIRNQLSFGMAAELIQQRYPEDGKIRKYTQMILDARDQILHLLDDIRTFVRQDRDRLYHKIRRNLKDTVERIIESARMDPELKHLTITTQLTDIGAVDCDHARIAQVLLNLLRNAGHATPESGQVIVRLNQENRHALIEVQDFGRGIEREHLEKIWEPFFSTKGELGLGLGLDICRKIIQDHQGRITCHSQSGKGTTFTITLPL